SPAGVRLRDEQEPGGSEEPLSETGDKHRRHRPGTRTPAVDREPLYSRPKKRYQHRHDHARGGASTVVQRRAVEPLGRLSGVAGRGTGDVLRIDRQRLVGGPRGSPTPSPRPSGGGRGQKKAKGKAHKPWVSKTTA